MHYKTLLKNIDCEIDAIVHQEACKITSMGQNNLHLLLENRKDLEKYAASHVPDHESEDSEDLDPEDDETVTFPNSMADKPRFKFQGGAN